MLHYQNIFYNFISRFINSHGPFRSIRGFRLCEVRLGSSLHRIIETLLYILGLLIWDHNVCYELKERSICLCLLNVLISIFQ